MTTVGSRARRGVAALLALLMLLGISRERVSGEDAVAVSVSALSDGTNLLVTFDRDASFEIDISAFAPRLVSLNGSKAFTLRPVVGQRMLSTPSASLQSTGAQHLALRFQTADVAPGLYNLELPLTHAVLDGFGDTVSTEYHRGALPLVSVHATPDDELSSVRHRYFGKVVYPATLDKDMYLFCTIPHSHAVYVVDDPSLHVVSVERSGDVGEALVPNGEELGDPRGVLALPPLRFTFAVSPDSRMHRVGWDDSSTPVEREAGRECARPSIVFSTAWHVDRMLRLVPAAVRVGLARADRKAIADLRPSIGMTHEQVAAFWGYPPDLLDVSALDRLSVWVWPNARDTRWVHFTGDHADSFTRR